MPISRASSAQRALELGLVVHLDQHVHAEIVRVVVERARLVVVDAAMITRMQSAPQARAS